MTNSKRPLGRAAFRQIINDDRDPDHDWIDYVLAAHPVCSVPGGGLQDDWDRGDVPLVGLDQDGGLPGGSAGLDGRYEDGLAPASRDGAVAVVGAHSGVYNGHDPDTRNSGRFGNSGPNNSRR